MPQCLAGLNISSEVLHRRPCSISLSSVLGHSQHHRYPENHLLNLPHLPFSFLERFCLQPGVVSLFRGLWFCHLTWRPMQCLSHIVCPPGPSVWSYKASNTWQRRHQTIEAFKTSGPANPANFLHSLGKWFDSLCDPQSQLFPKEQRANAGFLRQNFKTKRLSSKKFQGINSGLCWTLLCSFKTWKFNFLMLAILNAVCYLDRGRYILFDVEAEREELLTEMRYSSPALFCSGLADASVGSRQTSVLASSAATALHRTQELSTDRYKEIKTDQ